MIMKYEFSRKKLKIRPIYQSEALETYHGYTCDLKKIKDIYGMDLTFDTLPRDRPYLYASYVESMDGKLAYADIPDAFYVAQKNSLSEYGKNVDFWILNLLRFMADACVIGGNTLHIDPDYLMINFDSELLEENRHTYRYPVQIVTSLNGSDLPLDHSLLQQTKYPRIVSTSEQGYDLIRDNYSKGVVKIDSETECDLWNDLISDSLYVLVTGTKKPNAEKTMRFFKRNGIDRMLIESPGYGDYLIHQQLLDEIFFNFSCVYIGGVDAMTLGKTNEGFTADQHPHARVLSIHSYNDFYFYFRYKMEYCRLR